MSMVGLNQNLIDEILSAGNIFEVGGCVRDAIMGIGKDEKDRDYLVTNISFDKLVAILKKYGHVDLVGKSFGVIKFTTSPNGDGRSYTYDIALPRREYSIGSGHRDFKVDFDHTLPIEKDLERRDFTVNAIARNMKTDKLIDPFGGQDDIKHGVIRMLKSDTFQDDPLRMLRAVQFATRFEFEIEPQTYQAIRDNVELIETISPERIAEELNKLLEKSSRPSGGFRLLKETGLLEKIMPEMAVTYEVEQPGGFHVYDVFTHSILTVDHLPAHNLALRYAGLFHDIAKPQTKFVENGLAHFYGHDARGADTAEAILTRLRYSHNLISDVVTLIKGHMFTPEVTDKGLRRLIRRIGENLIYDLLELRRADVSAQGMGNQTPEIDELEQRIRAELDKKVPLGVGQLDIDGEIVMREFGLPQSPQVGEVLNYLLELVLDDPEKNKQDILIEQARIYLRDKERE